MTPLSDRLRSTLDERQIVSRRPDKVVPSQTITVVPNQTIVLNNARAVIRRLNPIIRGWAAYYRTQVSSQTFHALDQHLWQLTYKWALISHRNKSRPWVYARYFGKFNRSRQDRWVFGDRTSGVYLHRFSWTGIVRHQIVCGTASTDDPALRDYWATRRRTAPLPINNTSLRLYRAQTGRCPICKTALLRVDQQPPSPKDWERWLATARDTITIVTTGTAPNEAEHRLIHAHCQHGNKPGTLPAPKPTRPA